MKKGLLVLGVCLLFAGCGNKVVCTMTEEEDGIKGTMEVSAPVKDGKITKVDMTSTMEFDSKETAEAYCSLAKGNDKIKCNGKKVTMKDTMKYDEAVKKDEFIKTAEKEGYKCK